MSGQKNQKKDIVNHRLHEFVNSKLRCWSFSGIRIIAILLLTVSVASALVVIITLRIGYNYR